MRDRREKSERRYPRVTYKKTIIRVAAAAALALLCLLAVSIASRNPEWVSASYLPWSRGAAAALSHIFYLGGLPVAEFVFYALVLTAAATLLCSLIRLITRRSLRSLLNWLSHIALAAVSLVCVFFLLWGLNYYSLPLAGRIELYTEESSAAELYDTAAILRNEMNALADAVPRDEDGVCDTGGFKGLAPGAPDGFDRLAKAGGAVTSDPLPPKPMVWSSLLSRFGIGGIYIPFVGESVVNTEPPDVYIAFTVCHEMAHRMGYAPEDEANFVAFLSCAANPDPVYKYAAYYNAFSYCSGALRTADSALYDKLWEGVSPTVLPDFRAHRAYLDKYAGTLSDVGSKVNDTYLHAVGQQNGVKSYGRVVDLLIAAYKDEGFMEKYQP